MGRARVVNLQGGVPADAVTSNVEAEARFPMPRSSNEIGCAIGPESYLRLGLSKTPLFLNHKNETTPVPSMASGSSLIAKQLQTTCSSYPSETVAPPGPRGPAKRQASQDYFLAVRSFCLRRFLTDI